MGELIVIAIVALLFLGPEKLPEAAKTISKGIRDFRKQTRELQQIVEDDHEIGGAIRDLKSALRGDEPPSTAEERRRRAAEAARKAADNAARAADELRENAAGPKTQRISAGGGPDSSASTNDTSTNGEHAGDHHVPDTDSLAAASRDSGSGSGSGSDPGSDPDMPLLEPASGAVATTFKPRQLFWEGPRELAEADAEVETDADGESDVGPGSPPDEAHG